MDVKDYCSGLEMEMTAWKAKLYDLTRKVDQLGTKEKEKALANVQDLHILLTEMGDRVQQLKTECPSDWGTDKKQIEKASVDMRSKFESTMDYIGSAAPVSIPG
jgi:gamma-glutamyl:cysteine ligase YbdK (ATP-grasp superfamily)